MKRRKLVVRIAVPLTAWALATCGSALAAGPAMAQVGPSGLPCGCEPSFTIEKRQEIAGSNAGFTTAPLIAAIGETVEYEILVENTGHFPEKLSEFTDPNCDPGTIAGGPGTSPVDPGHSTVYTCTRLLTASGVYTNEATVTGSSLGMSVTETSNQVTVEVPAPPPPASEAKFTIEKRQQIAGSPGAFTTATLSGAIGQTVNYQITVQNDSSQSLTLSNFIDAHCDSGTIAGGPGQAPLAFGASTTYTCRHVLTSAGIYINEAAVTGTPEGGPPLTHNSNKVEVVVAASKAAPAPAPAAAVVAPVQAEVPHSGVKPCEASAPPFHGPSGPKRAVFPVSMSSTGVKQITFYLDARKLRTLNQSQAKGGKFTIKIDPRKLSHGRHVLSIRGTSTDPACGNIVHSSAFVRPFSQTRPVKFTG